MNTDDIDIDLPEHDCIYETTNESGFIDVEPAYRKSTVLRLIEADRKRIAELESANAELERLCDETYVAQGADAYNLACEEMEDWQAERRKAGKEVGATGSLCDGIQWLYSYIEELEADRKKIGRNDNDTRKRRGSIVNNASASSKTVDKGPWRAGVNRNDRRAFIESDDFTHDVRLYVDGDFADQDEKLAYAKGIADQLNATNQPTEHIKGEPVAYMFADEWGRTKIVLGKETAEYWCPPDENITPLYTAPQPLSDSDIPAEPDSAKCAECGAELIHVRPGKWQHPDCSQSSWAADLVSKTDWNNELSSWSDEDFIRIFHECPDLANRLRKMLAEPVKSTCKKCNGTGVESTRFHGVWPNGEECLEPIKCDQCDGFGTTSVAEPVKVDAEASVPSDTDIDELSREWGLASAAYPSKSMVRDFARALLARYK